jgi:hypothetical protein
MAEAARFTRPNTISGNPPEVIYVPPSEARLSANLLAAWAGIRKTPSSLPLENPTNPRDESSLIRYA